jgi:uncharacterized protein (UPF0261 family)
MNPKVAPFSDQSGNSARGRRIVILATMDTKGAEAAFLAECVRQRGHVPWLVDLSLAGTPAVAVDTTREEVAAAAGSEWSRFAGMPRVEAMEIAAKGAAAIVRPMVERGEAHGVIGIGGGTGGWLSNTIMAGLPIGFPKIVVSTSARPSGRTDIAVMPSIADVAGVNRFLGPILANAAGAICGMAEGMAVEYDRTRPLVAMTMFGVTTAGGDIARRTLEEGGCEVVVFHATGAGGATMEDLARQGMFQGILDWTTSEVTDELVGGVCTSGPARLEAAGAMGIPQVVIPGAVDVINFPGKVPPGFEDRIVHWHLPNVPLVRTDAAESRRIGAWIADKLNRATGPVAVLIPHGGYSALDAPGMPFFLPGANEAFESGLREVLRPDIPVETRPENINDEAFAKAAANALLALLAPLRK